MAATIKPTETEVEYMEDVDVEWISLVDKGANRTPFKVIKNEDVPNSETVAVMKTVWSSSYINSLNDDCFAVVESGYKDGDNKNARHLPFKDKNGKVDLPHLRNALARCNQVKSVLGNDSDDSLRSKAAKKLKTYSDQYLKKEEVVIENEAVIQSIIVPASQTLDNYKEKNEWVNEFRVVKTENHDVYNKYISMPIEDVEKDSVRLVKLTKGEDAFALIGKPIKKDGNHLLFKGLLDQPAVTLVPDVGGTIGANSEPDDEEDDDTTSPNNTESPIMEDDSDGYVQTFGDLFYIELQYLIRLITGTMQMSEMTNKVKKNIVFNALDAFKSFLAVGMDTTSKQITVGKREIHEDRSEVHMGDASVGMVAGSATAKNEIVNLPQAVGKSEDEVMATVTNMSGMMQRLLTILDPNYSQGKDPSVEEFQVPSLTSPISAITAKAEVDGPAETPDSVLKVMRVLNQNVENLLKALDPLYTASDSSKEMFQEPSLTTPPSATATIKTDNRVLEMLMELTQKVESLSKAASKSKEDGKDDDKEVPWFDKLKDKKKKKSKEEEEDVKKSIVVVTEDDDDDDVKKAEDIKKDKDVKKEDGEDDVDDECDDDDAGPVKTTGLKNKGELEMLKAKIAKLEAVVEKIDADIPEASIVRETAAKEEIKKEETVFAGIFGDLKKIR